MSFPLPTVYTCLLSRLGYFFIFFYLSFCPKVILLSISANNAGEQHDDEPSSDGHVQSVHGFDWAPQSQDVAVPSGIGLNHKLGFPK